MNDNLLGMNNAQADARRMLREFQLIPQTPTLRRVPLQKAPAFISAKQSCSVTQSLQKRQPLTQSWHCGYEPVTATGGVRGVGRQAGVTLPTSDANTKAHPMPHSSP